jgi:hypothetical protein
LDQRAITGHQFLASLRKPAFVRADHNNILGRWRIRWFEAAGLRLIPESLINGSARRHVCRREQLLILIQPPSLLGLALHASDFTTEASMFAFANPSHNLLSLWVVILIA